MDGFRRTNQIAWILTPKWAAEEAYIKFGDRAESSSFLLPKTGLKRTVAPFLRKWMTFKELTKLLESPCLSEKERKFPCNSETEKGLHPSFWHKTGLKHTVASLRGKWMNFEEPTTFLQSSCQSEKERKFPCNSETEKCLHASFLPKPAWKTRCHFFLRKWMNFDEPTTKLLESACQSEQPSRFTRNPERERSPHPSFSAKQCSNTRWHFLYVNGWILMNQPICLNPHVKVSGSWSVHGIQR